MCLTLAVLHNAEILYIKYCRKIQIRFLGFLNNRARKISSLGLKDKNLSLDFSNSKR